MNCPINLALPLQSGFSYNTETFKDTFEPEEGQSTPVVFSTNISRTYDVEYYLSFKEKEDFLKYYKNELKYGTKPVEINDPVNGELIKVRFVSEPEFTLRGLIWNMSTTLEVV